MELNESIRTIKGIGEKSEKLFNKLGITSVEELLSFYPRDYEIFTRIQPIASAAEGEKVILEGTLVTTPKVQSKGKRKIISVRFRDASGEIPVVWFNMPFLLRSLKMGLHYIIRGTVVQKNGRLQINQPQLLSQQEYANQIGKWKPVYPLTAGLSNNLVIKAMKQALKEVDWEEDFLPPAIRKKYGLLLRKQAVQKLHFPEKEQDYLEARKRLVFEEFFLFMLALKGIREEKHAKTSEYAFKAVKEEQELLLSLPFSLTEGQEKAWGEIKKDLSSGYVMNRLLQGDVGSGKTMIAILSLLTVAKNGCQGAIMAPTEVLAAQHFEEITKCLEPFGIVTELLTGSMTAAQKREAYCRIKAGEAQVIVGTHALIQEKVEYQNLALIITDEQHRFGVRQREAFSDKGNSPHMLVMSATPIPRTLAIILYGDLDISTMKGLPTERLPIKNCVVGTQYRPVAYRFMEKQIAMGNQVYIICPMVEESENSEAENVIDYTEDIREMISPSITVEYLHGKMKPAQKNEIMTSFSRGEIDILVSTTVIEVGINVPNATVIMIENAERFGLAQLHQLRGRVGRGKEQSYCIFMAGKQSRETMERLRILEKSNDGFVIAGEDLKLRGPGDLFGTRQSGDILFSLADIYRDADILQDANEAAKEFMHQDILRLSRTYRGLREKLQKYAGDIFL